MNYKIKVELQIEENIKSLFYIVPSDSLSEAINLVTIEVNKRYVPSIGTILTVTEDI